MTLTFDENFCSSRRVMVVLPLPVPPAMPMVMTLPIFRTPPYPTRFYHSLCPYAI